MTAARRKGRRSKWTAGIIGAVLSALVVLTGVGGPALAAGNDLTVDIHPAPTDVEVTAGETVTFEVQWQCGGVSNGCSGASLEVPVPLGQPGNMQFAVTSFTPVRFGTPAQTFPVGVVGTGADRKIVWHFPATMAGANTGTVTFTLQTENWVTPDGTAMTPTATFSANSQSVEETSEPAVVRSAADIQVVKTKFAPQEDPYVGSDATYEVKVGYPQQWNASGGFTPYSNMCNTLGLWAMEDVKVTDTLPPRTVFQSASAGGVYDAATHTVTWDLGKTAKVENGQAKCDPSTFGKTLLVTVNFPEDRFTNDANQQLPQTNEVAVTAKTWATGAPLSDETSVTHYLQIGADGEFTVQKGISYAQSNKASRQLWRGGTFAGGDYVRGYLHDYSIAGTGNARGTWSLVDMLPCGWTSPTDTNDISCATPAYRDVSFGSNGSMSELKVNWQTNQGRVGVCTIAEGMVAGDSSMRFCDGLDAGQPISMGAGEWITKFWLDENPVKGGTKGSLFLFGSVSNDIPLDNSDAVRDGVYQPHFMTSGEVETVGQTPQAGVTPASQHPLWVTIENCTADNTVRWNGGSMTRNGSVVDSNKEGRCGYTRVARDPVNVYAEKRMYNPDVVTDDGMKGNQPSLEPGDPVRVEVVTQRDNWYGQVSTGRPYTFTPTITEILPANLVYSPKDPSNPVYLNVSGKSGAAAEAVLAKLGEPRLTLRDVVVGGVTRTQVVIDFPNVPEGGGLALNDQVEIGFDARVRDNTPVNTYENYMLVQAKEAATGYLVCESPGSYADPKILDPQKSWADLSFNNAVQGPDADTGCRGKKPYTVVEGPGMNSVKEVRGTRDNEFIPAPGIGSTDRDGEATYRIPVRNTGNVDMRDVVVYDMLPRVGDHGAKPGADARGSEFNVRMTGPVTGLPAGATVQYSKATEPCRGELAGKGTGTLTSAPANCTNDWATDVAGDWASVTAIRLDFDAMVWSPGDTYTGTFPAVASGGDLTGTAWNNVAIAAKRTSNGVPMLPSEAQRVGLQLTPDLAWKKVDGANATTLLAGSEWTLTPVVPQGGIMPPGEWPRTIVDCTGGTCGEDRDPAAGKFTLSAIPWGTYELVETKAPSGFVLASQPIRFTLGEGNLDRDSWTYELGTIANFKPGVDLSWEKVDTAGTRLAGSNWDLVPVDSAGKPVPGGSVMSLSDCVADSAEECAGHDTDPLAGKFRLTNVPPGTYHLVETQAPAGFVKLDTPIEVTVVGDTAVDLEGIVNHQVEVPELPLTGGVGTFLFMLGGGAFLVLMCVFAVRSVRARRLI
ncbi:MSCRAMM family protein [Leucobacter aridicollis]|uniref:MSCRAMM family protein n=1 Tax=Leucobacter aridicollis TaxID=283878 RepID=UPI002103F8DD|nr:SpaA isopeptide-forming pilin-related protein [Leucobacter aridicollis]UTX53100.1 hypothetical protein KI794_15660 [Leucobacter aridicollis]